MSVADYCPTCDERTGLTDRGVCPWCDTPLEVKQRRRGGWKRPDKVSRLSDAHLRVLHTAHWQQGLAVRELGRRIYQRLGYSSPRTAAQAILDGWKRLGLQAKSRRQTLIERNWKHGKLVRSQRDQEFVRAQRQQREGRQPRCKAVKTQPPRKGQPCSRPAMRDSDYCVVHDPARAAERDAHLEAMRARKAA